MGAITETCRDVPIAQTTFEMTLTYLSPPVQRAEKGNGPISPMASFKYTLSPAVAATAAVLYLYLN